jgi:hypothetical protein
VESGDFQQLRCVSHKVVRCGKYRVPKYPKKRCRGSCAEESEDFQQLRSSSYKAVRCGKWRLSTAKRGFQQDHALVKTVNMNS